MPNHPDPSPAPFLGVEIHCTWPSAAFLAGAQPPDVDAPYEAFPRPYQRVAADTVAEVRQQIRQALEA